MAVNWEKIAKDAALLTDEHFKNKISSLTRLNDEELESLITQTGIGKEDLVTVLKEVKDATKSNTDKANAIMSIKNGVDALVGFATKLI